MTTVTRRIQEKLSGRESGVGRCYDQHPRATSLRRVPGATASSQAVFFGGQQDGGQIPIFVEVLGETVLQ